MEEPSGYPVFYNIDCGNKMSLTTSMERSPRRYHIMQSQAPRFRSSAVEVPFGVYNLDTGRKKTLESVARDNRRFYSSAFQSKAPRFARPWTSPVDLTYEPERTKNSAPATFSKSVELSNIKYSILRSRYKRFPDKPIMSNAPDITYSVDTYPRETLATAVKNSPISYRNMGASSAKEMAVKREEHVAHLGPGSYDFSYPKDLRSSINQGRPLSSMQSAAPRFNDKSDITKGLGTTWKPERDAKSWQKGTTISKASYLRPQYLPKSYADKKADR